ncbi:sensor histidine kinase [Phaeospirillum tilakii]|uniref:histidine kinase n=1 Tax=Phaeospirillum tilakii TaxID=741673 RepID=A0ABW5C7U8_9PROT
MPEAGWDTVLAASLPAVAAGAAWLGWRGGAAAARRRGRAELVAAERFAHLGRLVRGVPDGRFDWSDGALRLFGLTAPPPGTGDEPLFERLDPADRDRLREDLAAAALGRALPLREIRLRSGPESPRVLAARAEAESDRQGRVRRVVLRLQDVTERRALETELDGLIRELLRSNEELEQFASVASHDLRQPLRVVTIYVSLLEEDLQGQLSGEAAESLAYVRDGVRRMERLITDLLDYARVGRSAEDRPVPLDAVIATARADLAFEIAESGAMLSVPSDLPVLMGHQGEMERLWLNLLGNALKYRAADRPPRVRVTCVAEDSFWAIRIIDNGIGIPPDQAERVFGIFQRLHPRDAYPGTGIGLAIARKIAERHGGTLRVEPAEQGAVFLLRWPRR